MKLGILSDIHEDIESLRLVMNIFEQNQCDELVCLGDILGFDSNYYRKVQKPDASECINIIQNEFKFSVIGNHVYMQSRNFPNTAADCSNSPIIGIPLILKKGIRFAMERFFYTKMII